MVRIELICAKAYYGNAKLINTDLTVVLQKWFNDALKDDGQAKGYVSNAY